MFWCLFKSLLEDDYKYFSSKQRLQFWSVIVSCHLYNTSLNKFRAWHMDGAANKKKIHVIFIKY